MGIALAPCVVLAQGSTEGPEITPVTSVTNDYYTPKKTFTPATTFATVVSGVNVTITDQGPTYQPGDYTFTFTKPTTTMTVAMSEPVMRSLHENGHGPEASQLEPDPGALQKVRGAGVGAATHITVPVLHGAMAAFAVFLGAIFL